MIRLLALFLLGLGSLRPTFAETVSLDLPSELIGTWKIVSASGADPLLLQVARKEDLIGHQIQISKDHLKLWTVFRGTPFASHVETGKLRHFVVVPRDLDEGKEFSGSEDTLRFVEIAVRDCYSGSQRLLSCPTVIFAIRPKTGQVSFVPNSFGLAGLVRTDETQP